MKSSIIKNFVKTVTFLIILFLIIGILSSILNPAGGFEEWFASKGITEFYKQKENSIDIIYIGDSCVYSAVSPMEIYKNIGVTGYSLSSPGQKIWSSYYLLKDVLKTQKPKVVFLEIGEAFSARENEEELNKRNVIDAMKFSKNKLEMINDEIYGFSAFEKLGCVLPIFRYHSRWSDLNESDIRKLSDNTIYTYKGYLLDKKKKSYTGKKENNNDIKITEDSTKYIDKIVELCNENSIKIVFMKIPEPVIWNEKKNSLIKEVASKRNIEFIDFNYERELNLNWENDTQDNGYHLNIYGAEKLGKCLSKYIDNKFKLKNHREEKEYASWEEFLKLYNDAKSKNEVKI